MVTTRRARRAQSEEDQSPLRAIEVEPKSRKKISREPKTIGPRPVNKKTVDDNKIAKRKVLPSTKGRTKRPEKAPKEQQTLNGNDRNTLATIVKNEELSDNDMLMTIEESPVSSKSSKAVNGQEHSTSAASKGPEHQLAAEAIFASQTDSNPKHAKGNEKKKTKSHKPKTSQENGQTSKATKGPNGQAPVVKKKTKVQVDIVNSKEGRKKIITHNAEAESTRNAPGSPRNEPETGLKDDNKENEYEVERGDVTEHGSKDQTHAMEDEPERRIDIETISKDCPDSEQAERLVSDQSTKAQPAAGEEAEHASIKPSIEATASTPRSRRSSAGSSINQQTATRTPQQKAPVNSESPIARTPQSPGSSSIVVAPCNSNMDELRSIYDDTCHLSTQSIPKQLNRTEMKALTRILGKSVDPTKDSEDTEKNSNRMNLTAVGAGEEADIEGLDEMDEVDSDDETDGSEESEEESAEESDEDEQALCDSKIEVEQTPEETEEKVNTTTEDEETGGSWLRRSLTKVATSVNPLSWLTPRRHIRPPIPNFSAPTLVAARRPLTEASGTLLNTSSSGSQIQPSSARSHRNGKSAGSSLGLYKDKSARTRARRLQEEASNIRDDKLARRESINVKTKEQPQEESAATGEKRKRILGSPGGRSTYSLDDALSPSTTFDSPPSSSPFFGNTQKPVTPSRTATANFQTPLFSILRGRDGGSEPASKRIRTGGRSVVWKEKVEDDSPLEKYSPPRSVRYVPNTPVPRANISQQSPLGLLSHPSESALKSAQKPGASRTTFPTRSYLGSSTRRIGTSPTKVANMITVPDDSSDEESDLMVTPSKKSYNNIDSAGSTPHPITSSAKTPPSAPQLAHATLPTGPATSQAHGTPGTYSSLFSPVADSRTGAPLSEDERLNKMRSRVNQFTPKQPSRLRESESTGLFPGTDAGDQKRPAGLGSLAKVDGSTTGSVIGNLPGYLQDGADFDLEYAIRSSLGTASFGIDNEVMDAVVGAAVSQEDIQSYQARMSGTDENALVASEPSLMDFDGMTEELNVDPAVAESVKKLWCDEHARQLLQSQIDELGIDVDDQVISMVEDVWMDQQPIAREALQAYGGQYQDQNQNQGLVA